MRRRPLRDPLGTPPNQAKPIPLQASGIGDAQEAWLVSGGYSYYPAFGEGFNAAPDGAALLCFQYIPKGNVGWLKQLRCAPTMPSQLAQPWVTSGAVAGQASWVGFGVEPRAAGQNGVWTTPFGWEAYFDLNVFPYVLPQWRWRLTLIQGDVAALRSNPENVPRFNVLDPSSWWYLPNIPVPATAYPAGIPGTAPGRIIGPQRMQVLQGDELTWHVMIPENTSLCLWAEWSQVAVPVQGQDQNGLITYSEPVFPIGPSFGQLSGYMQSLTSVQQPAASVVNARHGWGG